MARVKKRAISTDAEPNAEVLSTEQKIKHYIAKVYALNERKKQVTKEHASCRASLYKLIRLQPNKSAEGEFINPDGRAVKLQATVPDKKSSTVDIKKLKELVSDEVFLEIITATQDSVKNHAGSSVLNACLKSETKDGDNVVVEPIK